MALPKLNVPVYEAILPSTEKVIKYRPFLVKEEKLLFTAQESGEEAVLPAVKQIIKNCVQGELDIDNMPLFDIEYLFLRLRAKSVGEISKFRVLCPDDKKTYAHIEVDLTKIDVQVDDKHTNKIIIDDTKKLGLVLKYPSLSLFRNPSNISENPEEAFKLVVSCIDHIFEGEKIYPAKDSTEKELTSFLEDLTQKNFEKIKDFFDTMPKLKHEIEVENPKTKVKSKIVLQGLKDFFVSASPTST